MKRLLSTRIFTVCCVCLVFLILMTACSGSGNSESIDSAPELGSVDPSGGDTAPSDMGELVATSVYLATPMPSGDEILEEPAMIGTPYPTAQLMPTTLPGDDMGIVVDGADDSVMSTPAPTIEGDIVSPASIDGDIVLTATALGSLLVNNNQQPRFQLNAGEINDNDDWSTYLDYRDNYLRSYASTVRNVDINQRQIITVTDPQGYPISDARVMIFNGNTFITESRTYADGQTLFFPNAWTPAQNTTTFRVVVQKDNVAVEFALDPQLDSSWLVTLDTASQTQAESIPLDVVFLLDATGSMADEIAQLQDNLLSISAQIDMLEGNIDTRYALVTYRDRGDAYVVRSNDFVADVQSFQTQLNAVSAGGGGDYPEALNEALHTAVREMSWRTDDAIRLIFLVSDAPPHIDYQVDWDYSHEMIAAAWNGIKVHPIASSGLQPSGEYIFRQIAQYTMGNFIFLTYDNSVPGTPGTERDDLAAASSEQVEYSVDYLDDMVLRLIVDEINALSVPVDMQGTQPQLESINPLALRSAPDFFALIQDLPLVARVAPSLDTPDTPIWEEPLFLVAMGVTVFFGALMLTFFGGYMASHRSITRQRKQKVKELFLEPEQADVT